MKNRKIRVLLTIIAFAFVMVAHAAPVTEEMACNVASGFLSKNSVAQRILEGRTVDSVEAFENLWVAHLSPSGHIILSGTTKNSPVLSFSQEDFTEPADDTAQMDMFESWIERCSASESDDTLEDNADWEKYATVVKPRRPLLGASISFDTKNATEIVGPLIVAKWHQGAPYNDLTPLGGIPCGCSATAGGQELYYWKWPHRMEHDFTFVHTLNGVENSYTNRMNGLVPFDWDKMRDNYKNGNTDITTFRAEDKASTYAAAHLINWVQPFVHMNFGNGGSGATAKLNASVMTNEWYESAGDLGKKMNGVDDFPGLWTAITNDVAFGSPINVNSSGHQMVVEGYAVDSATNEYICLNYGWGGGGAWVDLENEIDVGGAGGTLAHFQIGFRPKKRVQFDIVPKVSKDSVRLVWYLPHCYTNRIDGFERIISDGSTTSVVTNAVAAGNLATVYTNDVSLAGYSGEVTFTVTPIMKEGEGEGLPTSVTTSIGKPHDMPAFESISAIGGGLELMQEGFYAECGMGITNTITVTCSEDTTGLKAIPTHISVLPDERVSVVTNGNVFTVHVDATAMDPKWDGDMILLTLVASNADGTEVAKNLMLRFNSTRQVLDGTFEVVSDGEVEDSLWFCGENTVIDAKGKPITFKSNAFMGTGTVTLTNSVSGGSFTFESESLDYFNGTLKWLSTTNMTVTLPSNCNIEYEGAWRYAVRDNVTPADREPVPEAVWNGDFEAIQTGYSLDLNDNALSDDKSTITINKDVGVKVDFDTGLSGGMTVMFKYANLDLSHTNTLVTSYVSGQNENKTGVYLDAEGKANGLWVTTSTHNNGADQKTVGSDMTSGTMAFYYQKDNGTILHYVNGVNCRRIFKCSSLRDSVSDTYINGCTVGGERARENATLFPAATGLQITGIAIFSGKLTREQMVAYVWPVEIKKYAVSANTTVSALNDQIAAAVSGGFRVMEIDVAVGTTISVDVAFSAGIPVMVKSEGNITLSAETMHDASYFRNVDFSGVKGAVLRSWLAPGVVGFNFYSTKGRKTSNAIVAGTWYENLTEKDGTSTEMFEDGLSALTWSSSTCYGYNEGTLMNGYLDDGDNGGNGATITLSNIPYERYEVIIYASTDTANADFTAKTVNGTTYTWNTNELKVVVGNESWGRTRCDTPENGVNALHIEGLTGPLTIYGGKRNSNTRGGIAAIQIMPPYYTLTITNDCSWSEGAWTIATGESIDYVPAGGRVKIVANASATLTIDSNVSIDDLVIIGDHKDDISFNIQPDVTFTLYKSLDMPVLNLNGGGRVVCLASDTLAGRIKGSCVIEYPEGILPEASAVFTDLAWTGTNVFTNCGNENNGAHKYVNLNTLGNDNSFIKMPGYNGYLAQNTIYGTTLIIDEGTVFNISNGDSGKYNLFRKVVGEGTFLISGDQTATTQVVLRDVSGFAGAFDMMGEGHKGIVVGAPDDWTCDYDNYQQKVVVAGNVTLASGKTWDVTDSQGVVVLGSGTLTFGGAGASISGKLTLNSGATVKLPADAVFPYRLATSGELPAEGTVNFYVGEVGYTGRLSFTGGVLRPKSDVVITAALTGEDPVDWDDLDWNLKYPEALTNQVTVSASGTINFGTSTFANTAVFNVSGEETLTLDGSLTATNIIASSTLTLTPTSVVNAASLVLTNGVLKLEMDAEHSPTLDIGGMANLAGSIILVDCPGSKMSNGMIPLMTADSFVGLESVILTGLGTGWTLEFKEGALYARGTVASITESGTTKYYSSLSNAVEAASTSVTNAVSLLADDSSNVVLNDKAIIFENNDHTFSGTLTGNGTMIITNAASATTWVSSRFSEGWIGTVYLKNVAKNGLDLNNFGTSRSTVRMTGCSGYLASNSYAGTLDLQDDGDTKAFVINNAGTGAIVVEKLTGSGSLACSQRLVSQCYVFRDVSEFVGSISCARIDSPDKKYLRVILGDLVSQDPADGTITVVSGNVATIAGGKTWAAATNVVYGTLAFNGTGAMSGDVEVKPGATLCLTNSTVSTPIAGTLSLEDNVTVLLPESATFPRSVASSGSGHVDTLWIGDRRTSATLANGNLILDVASVDGHYYTNLTNAVAAVNYKAGKVITLLENTDETITIPAGETLQIIKGVYDCPNVSIAGFSADASCTTNDSGVVTYTSYIARAAIESTYYASLSNAVEAASTSVTNAVSLLADDSSNVVLNDKAIIFENNDHTFSGTLTGNGTMIITNAASATTWVSSRFSEGWIGTVYLKNVAKNGLDLNNFGTSRSTVRMTGCSGYLAANSYAGTLDLQDDGDKKAFTVNNAGVDSVAVVSKLTGSGTLSCEQRDFSGRYVFKNATEFIGSINCYKYNSEDKESRLRVILGDGETIATPADSTITVLTNVTVAAGKTWTAPGGIVLFSKEATVTVENTAEITPMPTLSEALTSKHCHRDTSNGGGNTVYSVAKVAQDSAGMQHCTIADALAAIGDNPSLENTITLIHDTDESVELPVGYALRINNKNYTGSVTFPEGAGLVEDASAGGSYTCASRATAIWTGDAGDGRWANPTNWSPRLVPIADTAVTIETAGTIYVTGNDGSEAVFTNMTVNADVVLSITDRNKQGDSYPSVGAYGNISGTGSLTLWRTGIRNKTASEIVVGVPLSFDNNGTNDSYIEGGSFRFTEKVSATNGLWICYRQATFDKDIELGDNAKVTFTASPIFGEGSHITGSGAVQFNVAPDDATISASRFSNWTGTFVVGWGHTTYSGFVINNYGIQDSKIEFASAMTDGYFTTGNAAPTVNATIIPTAGVKLDRGYGGNTDGSWSNATVFNGGITGSGNLEFWKPSDTLRRVCYSIANVEEYSGTITLHNYNWVRIAKVTLDAEPEPGRCIVSMPLATDSSNPTEISVKNGDGSSTLIPVWVNDTQSAKSLFYNSDGLYVAVAKHNDICYTNYQDAVTAYNAAGSGDIDVLDATAGNVPTGWEISNEGASLTKNQCTIKFVDGDGTELSSTTYDYGTVAADVVKPDDPTKADDGNYAYTFTGWTPAIEDVTSNATYTATYNSTALAHYSITPKSNWFAEGTRNVDCEHASPDFYDITNAAPVGSTTYRIETVINELIVNTSTNVLPNYAEQAYNPYASIAPANNEGNDYWFGWDRAASKWQQLGARHPVDGGASTNAIEFTINDEKLNVTYSVDGAAIGVITNAEQKTLPSLTRLGFSGYGRFQSYIGEGIEAKFEISTIKEVESIKTLLNLESADHSVIEAKLAEKGANGLRNWQNVVLGLPIDDANKKPFVAPVQNTNPGTISFAVGNCVPNDNLRGKSPKFQVYEVTSSGAAVSGDALTSGDPVGIERTATIDLSGHGGVRYFKIKIVFE